MVGDALIIQYQQQCRKDQQNICFKVITEYQHSNLTHNRLNSGICHAGDPDPFMNTMISKGLEEVNENKDGQNTVYYLDLDHPFSTIRTILSGRY